MMIRKIAILETGLYHDTPDITRVFSSVEKAIENIPPGFKKIDVRLPGYYYEYKTDEKWLSIKEYEIEC